VAEHLLSLHSHGHLYADGNRVAVDVVDYCGKAVQIKFTDKPLIGGSPWCWLDFDTPEGLARYYTQVCAATYDADDGLVLVRVPGLERNGLREFARVPASFKTVLKRPDGVLEEAELINISSGGALVESRAALGFRGQVGLELSVPEKGAFSVGGQVVHVEEMEGDLRRYGIRFVEVDRTFLRGLFEYLWGRLKELFPMRPRTR